MKLRKASAITGSLATLPLVLSACGGGDIAAEEKENESQVAAAGDCGELNMAVNPWVGFAADAYVVGHLAETELGCTVNYKDLKEEVSWQGFGTGEVDVVIEDWGHPDLEKLYFEDQGGDGSAVEMGPTGNVGIIGWYVAPWMAEEYPDITDWENLNDYADMFETPESGGKGQFLGADPSYVQFDEAIVANLGLDFQVVFSGSEAASIAAFEKAEANKTPLIGYFYEPQWFMSEVPLVKVNLPEFTDGCQDVAQDVACDYPETQLQKIVATEFAESGSPAVDLVSNFQWTNDDQNLVAKYISVDGMSAEEAAATWVEENPDKVEAWMS
ncbi:glycine/betaine-binding protein [Nocardioides psychrotolerans]|uniref:Glycine betaine/proline transport system substrate-binding protein n=1 Tax=Nocardioides psychrotolerans TaxID=1005945 RepID=A0A1I3ETK4_9ACTN|nr:ABC transporter substrate-binding protein [Nocardioides psychrotolerans]GEP39145.1 glycine/betaine-binding protein [Nocardioides psychrotolerans]SFI02294.1 glycine betaine/proline transport system substrate-binding protein [Nocardioides psychrotolerans]